jgi:hypothetical protein
MNIWRHWGERFERRTWVAPCTDLNELEWRLRYAQDRLCKADLLAAAGAISCYSVLVEMPERDRREIVRELRKGPSTASEAV